MISIKVRLGGVDLTKAKVWDRQAMAELADGVRQDFWDRAWVDQNYATGKPFDEGIDLVETGQLRDEGLTTSVAGDGDASEVFVTGPAAAYADRVNSLWPFMGWTEGSKEVDAFRLRAGRMVRQAIMRSVRATPEAAAQREAKLIARRAQRKVVRARAKKKARVKKKAELEELGHEAGREALKRAARRVLTGRRK